MSRTGILRRSTFPEVPPRVEYALTGFGERLMPIIDALGDWWEGMPRDRAPVAAAAAAVA